MPSTTRSLYLSADKVRAGRLELGLSQEQLAEKARVGKNTIANIEAKPNHRCHPNTADKVARALATPIAALTCCAQSNNVYLDPNLTAGLGDQLLGRGPELARLDAAWSDPSTSVLTVVGVGGQGKTALVKRWLDQGGDDFRGAAKVMGWSFAGQGVDGSAVAPDEFLTRAWEHFADGAEMPKQWNSVAFKLAGLIAAQANLLVLDGLEVFQHPLGPDAGKITAAEPIKQLLSHLADKNAGLCIVTSRVGVEDLLSSRNTRTPQLALGPLSQPAAVELLRHLGVPADAATLGKLSDQLWSHPLSLLLIGRYLADHALADDIQTWANTGVGEADRQAGGLNRRVMAQYCRWFDDPVPISLLKLVALFDSAVAIEVIEHFRELPAIGQLTPDIVLLADQDWRQALAELGRTGLLTRQIDHLSLHPIVRQYFRTELQHQAPQDYRDAQQRVYDFLLEGCDDLEPSCYDDLLDLHDAVLHGLEAGLFETCFNEVIWPRLLQGFPAVSLHMFNAGALHRILLRQYFVGEQLHPQALKAAVADPTTRARVLWWAGMVLRLTGDVEPAVPMFKQAAAGFSATGDLVGEVASVTYVSRCQHTQGRVSAALASASHCMAIVEQDAQEFHRRFLAAGNASPTLGTLLNGACRVEPDKVSLFQRLVSFPLADSLHYRGQLDEAMAIFEQAYRSDLPDMVALWDLFIAHDAMYYDLLLTLGHHQTINGLVAERLNHPTCSNALRSLMNTIGLRARIAALDDPAAIPQMRDELRTHGEQIDYRSSHHYVLATIELAAAARRLGDQQLAADLLQDATALKDALHWELGTTDLLIEDAHQRRRRGDYLGAYRQATRARERTQRDGYLLRQAGIEQLIASLGR